MEKYGRKSIYLAGTFLLATVVVTTTTTSNAEPVDPTSTVAGEGALEVRLEVPTSTAFDPLAENGDADPEAGAVGPWVDLEDYPNPVFDNRIGSDHSFGGSDGSTVSNEMWWYLTEWRDGGITPGPRQAAAIGENRWGEMLRVGGWDENGNPTSTTDYYDPASDPWVYRYKDMPSARAAAGYASFSKAGAMYVIGGCTTTECNPVSDSVFFLDQWHKEWATVADYPVAVAFPSCGAWKERIYCTGGHNGTEGISDSYVYDRATDVWSALPAPPTDSWGAQHAMVDGVLLVNGGVQGGAITNNTFGYDVKSGSWVDLPNSNTAKYRGAGGCIGVGDQDPQFVSVGGLNGTDEPLASAEILPGFDACDDGVGVPDVTRYDGLDRYGTAAAISALSVAPQETVFVTSGENFPDALATAARAGSVGAPILLTPSDTLAEETRAELVRLSPQNVIVVGGVNSVNEDVVELIAVASNADSVERIAGANRYSMAAGVAAEFESADTVFVATGVTFPDALASAGRAGSLDAPLLLVKRNSVPEATATQLERLSPENIVLVGGTASVSRSVENELGDYGTVERVAGDNRWDTSALIADTFGDADRVAVASGRDWPDALTGAARAGSLDIPVLLVSTDRIPSATRAQLLRFGPRSVEIYGGPGAVSRGVFGKLNALYE